MFPDSAITKMFGCARIKTTEILNSAMMPALQKHLVDCMKTQPFSLTNDGNYLIENDGNDGNRY